MIDSEFRTKLLLLGWTKDQHDPDKFETFKKNGYIIIINTPDKVISIGTTKLFLPIKNYTQHFTESKSAIKFIETLP